MFNKQKIINYLEKRHLEDGGYFFARVPPSSGQDTFFAVKTLKILGEKPKNPMSLIKFWQNEETSGNLNSINGLFYAIETYKNLNYPINSFEKYKPFLQSLFQKIKQNISLKNASKIKIDSEIIPIFSDLVENEAKLIYYLTSLSLDLNINIDQNLLIEYIQSLKNNGEGFGKIKGSEISTTCYCLEISKKIKYSLPNKTEIINYIIKELNHASYLEDYYWSTKALNLLKIKVPKTEKIINFLTKCQRENGGFSRSEFIGISTIEYTFFAVSILKKIEQI